MQHQPETEEPAAESHAALEAFLREEIATLSARREVRYAELAALIRRAETAEAARAMIARLAEVRIARLSRPFGRWRDALRRWRQARALRAEPLFDAAWYRAQGGDLAGHTPEMHYLLIGYLQCRDPGPEFGTLAYYTANPDVIASGTPALAHYLEHGRAEGRRPAPA